MRKYSNCRCYRVDQRGVFQGKYKLIDCFKSAGHGDRFDDYDFESPD
jgi:hypothetical protein